MTQDQLNRFYKFAVDRHDIYCNQKYDKKLPYSFHLEMVAKQASLFASKVIRDEDIYLVLSGCYGHDLIEDARLTYNDILNVWGYELAEIIYLCTHSKQYYEELATNELAVFVKLCDIIANVKYSLLTNSTMLDKYRTEYSKVTDYLYLEKYDEMFKYLDKLFAVK